MKCTGCGKREAEYLMFEDIVMPLCRECLDEYCYEFGSMSLEYWHLDELLDSPSELESFIERINRELKYWQERYRRLLEEYTKLKQEAGEKCSVNRIFKGGK
ncbi:MAG: hypothetical protein DRJ31_11175 [Candidatus Methanomethylicota archaeon]|uniref:Uncharacterized protein n=1 Tax=Thermoproteota archaeon TaxID=2056631 RepID=A0A497EL71_9CREN|nr:MAG: hypothetical protein DRJ31_11175 [Candidatus Verstraetearchaeota archaeon]